MILHRIFWVLLLTVTTAQAEPFGSEALLRSLWTRDELAGSPSDHVVTRPYAAPADTSPPQRTQPLVLSVPTPGRLQGVIRRVRPVGGEKVLAL